MLTLCGVIYAVVGCVVCRTKASPGVADPGNEKIKSVEQSASDAKQKALGEALTVLSDQIAIMITWAQILSNVTRTYDRVLWPQNFRGFSRGLSAVNIDPSEFFPYIDSCSLGLKFFDRLKLHILTPVAISVTAALAYLSFRARGHRGKQVRARRRAQSAVLQKIIFYVMVLIYPSLCRHIFEVFRCRTIGEPSWSMRVLETDFGIECGWSSDSKHLAWQHHAALAVVGIVFCAIGVPVFVFATLWRHRDFLHDKSHPKHVDTQRRLGFLFESYEPGYWWWECVLLVQKCIMTGLLVIIAPGTTLQLFIGFLFAIIYMMLVLRLGPYVGDQEDVLSFLASVSLSLTMLAGFTNITNRNAREAASDGVFVEEDSTLGSLLILVNLVPPIYFVLVNVARFVSHLHRRKRQRITNADKLEMQAAVKTDENHAAVRIVPTVSVRPFVPSEEEEDLSHEDKAERLIQHYSAHETHLQKTRSQRQQKSKRKTQLRLKARTKVKSSRVLSKVPAFAHLSEEAIGKIVDVMVYESVRSGRELCREGDVADRMFIVVSGTCSVTSTKAGELKCLSPLGKLNELDIVGESMLCDDEADRVRIATVTADATPEEKLSLEQSKSDSTKNKWIKTGVQMLSLSRGDYEKLVLSGVIGSGIQSALRSVGESRRIQNHEKLVAIRALRSIQGVPHGTAISKDAEQRVETIAKAFVGGAKKNSTP
jgi:CRP-like cAMP-binding protein